MNLPQVIREYVLKMLGEASVGMKALILDDFTVSVECCHLPQRLFIMMHHVAFFVFIGIFRR